MPTPPGQGTPRPDRGAGVVGLAHLSGGKGGKYAYYLSKNDGMNARFIDRGEGR
jgi:hypothetical protein